MKLVDETLLIGKRAVCRSFAKINLTLDITGKREDGYHTLDTIMQSVNLFDMVMATKRDTGINIVTNKKYLPVNEKNICYKASELFFSKSNIKGGVNISIKKSIPIAAGLAGGSGNGAATLCLLNALYDMPFSDNELLQLASMLGADVPYCMTGGVAKATGIGDIMEPINTNLKSYILLVTPRFAVSTPWAYQEYDKHEKLVFPNCSEMQKALQSNDYYKMCENLSNVLEPITSKSHKEITKIKKQILSYGANGCIMSGSGPTVFGFFDDLSKAREAYKYLSNFYFDTILTRTI